MANIFTSAGAALLIGTTASDQTTDTYVNIASVTDIPEFGRVYNIVKVQTLDDRAVKKIMGSYDEGDLQVKIARDPADPGQAAALLARDVDSDYNFKVTVNDALPAVSATVTITIASPGQVSWTAHGLPVNTAVKFSTTGALPTGLTAGTTYYVKTVVDANTFTLSATPGGSAINTSGTQSGVHTGTTIPAGSYITFKAKVTSYTTAIGQPDAAVMSTLTLALKSGSLIETPHLP